MIVRSAGEHLLLITQPDHARLAAAIMQHCIALSASPRRNTIMLAIAQHDCGWAIEDASPRVDPQTGQVLDFIHAPTEVRQGVWPRCIAQLEAEGDQYAAALVAQHALTVYDRLRSDRDWQPFFDDITRRRDALIARSAIPLAQLVNDYAFVRLGDLISLTFCTEGMELSQFGEWRVRRTPDAIVVEPDLFGGVIVPIEISARELPTKTYASDAALHEALRSAPTHLLRATVHGGA